MTESKIETTSELTGVGSVFDVPGASLVAQQDICLHEGFLIPSFFFSSLFYIFFFLLLMVGLHLGHELFREVLEGGQQGRREFNRDVIF